MNKDTQHILLETVSMLLEEYLKDRDQRCASYKPNCGNYWHEVLGKLQYTMMTVYDEGE